MKASLSGRADLLRALAQDDPALTAAMADVLGYDEIIVSDVSLQPPSLMFQSDTPSPTVVHEQGGASYEPADVPFWRLETYETVVSDEEPPESPQPLETVRWQKRPTEMPDFSPLAPKQVVLTRLRQVPAVRRPTSAIDMDAVVDRLGRGRLLDHIPQRQRRTWGSNLHIIEDRSRRLVPYWLDQEYVIAFLRLMYPSNGVTVARIGDDEYEPMIRWPKERRGRYIPPLPGTMVLVLGDLGCLASEGESLRRFWLHWGLRLRAQQIPAVALVPLPTREIPRELAQVWSVVQWDASPARVANIGTGETSEVVSRLLTLISPVVRLEPGLLRAVRCLLPEGRRDAGLEARVWQNAAIASRHSVAATLDPEQRRVYQPRFAREPATLRRLVLDRVRAWRANLNEAVWFEEVIGLDSQSQDICIEATDLQDARAFFTAFDQVLESGPSSPGAAAWILRLAERLPKTVGHDRHILRAVQRMFDRVRPRDAETEIPAWYDPAAVAAARPSVRQVTLWQAADCLLLQLSDAQAARRASPLGTVQTASGEVMIASGKREPPISNFWQAGQPPAWAHRWGWDDVGPWVSFRIGEAEQRMRWIPAGRFVMGSPESEEGRWDDEDPQHEAELNRGFWLFDTPCTQALWQVVMGHNPSRFQGENRPVEQVSWADCKDFISALNRLLPGLEMRLPTETQWEYACRAGITTARYHEDLDAIAWYRDNSDFETHEVGLKRPNAWGLYDMIGNVFEWCDDTWQRYTRTAAVDPVASAEAGAHRAVRGGGWYGSARYLRAASRNVYVPGYRSAYLGFRCSSSGYEPARRRGALRELGQKAEPAETTQRRPAARLLRLQEQPRIATALPEGEGFRISTDRDRLYVGRITRPPWASEIGRDVHGLWAVLDVDGVRQHMRWIPPGRFWMGSPEDDREAFDFEKPRHEVLLTHGFWLFDTPCTQALWQTVMKQNPSRFEGENRPVERVSWEDCQSFIARLNQRFTGLDLGLPTEAEWEYACRAGTETSRYADDLDSIAWYERNSGDGTHDVKEKTANTWGLYDMLGNVLEWCYDSLRNYHSTAVDPAGSAEAGAHRVIRGGGWGHSAQSVRTAYRVAVEPGLRLDFLGFRCSSSGQASRQVSREATVSDRPGVRPEAHRADAGRRRRRGR